MLVPVRYLALQAVVTFVIDDFAGGFDRRYLALRCAALAGAAAVGPSPQPVKNSKPGEEAKTRTKRAEVLAVKFAVEDRDEQQQPGVGDKP